MTPDGGNQPGVPTVATETRGALAEIRLERPRSHNSIDLLTARALDAALTAAEADGAVRVLLLTATGPTFCAGQDLRALAAGEPEAFVEGHGWAGLTHRRRTKPLVAVVQGAALAGGFEIVLAADLVVASTLATFGLPEVRHGLLAAAGGAARLPTRVPRAIANELLLTGEPIDAKRATALGLVNRLVESSQLLGAAEELALQVASNPRSAVTAALAVADRAGEQGERAANELAAQSLAELLGTAEVQTALSHWASKSSGSTR